jgi:endonuclease/exonuclease/phosphatase family metal-dependent hydrolase
MDAASIRALTFNVRRDVAADDPYHWAGRADAVANTLRLHRPDVVGLQEPLSAQYEDLRETVAGYEWVGRSRCPGKAAGEFCPVGYRADRFTREDGETFWLSETPDRQGSVGWDASHPRIATWVRLHDEQTDRSVVFMNTHFDHEGAVARQESARVLLDRLAAVREGDPAVLAGDYNCTPDEEPYAVLTGERDRETPLVDARAASSWVLGATTTKTDFESPIPDRRIDHVFATGLAVDGYAVATHMAGDGWFPSDHFPVVVDLSW